MTDPQMGSAGSPGPESGTSPPTPGGKQTSRHGLFHRSSKNHEPTGGSATATATRTSASSTSVPQQAGQGGQTGQAGQVPSARAPYGEEYGAGIEPRGFDPGMSMMANAANKSWPALLLGGLAMIAVGVMLLVWPHASLTVVAILIGAALVVSGLVRLWEGLTSRSELGGGRAAAYVVIGLLAVLAGLYCLRHHAISLFVVAFLTGVYFVAHGIADLGMAIIGGVPSRALRAVLGVFSIAAGILMVVWPAITLVILLALVAAWLLFYGCMLAFLSFSLRRAAKAMTSKPTQATTAMPAGAA